MLRNLWLIIRSIALPLFVLIVGAILMSFLSGHGYVTQQLQENADPVDRQGLNMRILGYDTNSVERHWSALDERALRSERRFLELDLIFPTFYGAALAFALWRVWKGSGTALSPVWLIMVVAITMIADWIENLTHLSQLHLYMESGPTGLQPEQIQIASMATIVKLAFFVGILLFTAWKSVHNDQTPAMRGS